MKSKLNKYQRAEFKDLYDGSFQSLKEMARLFKVSIDCMMWYVDHNDHRRHQTARATEWRLKNPKRYKVICKRANKAFARRKKLGLGPILHNYE